MNPYDSEVRLPLTHKVTDYAQVKARLHLAGCELIGFHAEAVGRYGAEVCPRCLRAMMGPFVVMAQRRNCYHCKHPFVVFPFLSGEKGILYVSIPWAD